MISPVAKAAAAVQPTPRLALEAAHHDSLGLLRSDCVAHTLAEVWILLEGAGEHAAADLIERTYNGNIGKCRELPNGCGGLPRG
jgi:hypothetical protein